MWVGCHCSIFLCSLRFLFNTDIVAMETIRFMFLFLVVDWVVVSTTEVLFHKSDEVCDIFYLPHCLCVHSQWLLCLTCGRSLAEPGDIYLCPHMHLCAWKWSFIMVLLNYLSQTNLTLLAIYIYFQPAQYCNVYCRIYMYWYQIFGNHLPATHELLSFVKSYAIVLYTHVL